MKIRKFLAIVSGHYFDFKKRLAANILATLKFEGNIVNTVKVKRIYLSKHRTTDFV